MILTRQIIHSAGSGRFQSGFNYHQLKLLGVPWPPKQGWLDRLVGRDIPDHTWDLVLRMSGKPKSNRRKILAGDKAKQQYFANLIGNFTAD